MRQSVAAIVLVGYRGSGKSTVGRLVADALQLPFTDTDEQVVAEAGLSIADIFSRWGEPRFRAMESVAVARACAAGPGVVAVGGGAVLAEANRIAMRSPGNIVCYLRCDPVELHSRISADAATITQRPPLTPLGGSVVEIRALLAIREPLYREVMNVEIDVSQKNACQAANSLVEHIRGNQPGKSI